MWISGTAPHDKNRGQCREHPKVKFGEVCVPPDNLEVLPEKETIAEVQHIKLKYTTGATKKIGPRARMSNRCYMFMVSKVTATSSQQFNSGTFWMHTLFASA